jgi:hypothetical protein
MKMLARREISIMKLLARDFVVSQTVINRCYESDEGACDLAPFLPGATFPLFVRTELGSRKTTDLGTPLHAG